MLQIRFGYSTNPKAIVVKGEDTVQSLCQTHHLQADNCIINHNGLPLSVDELTMEFSELGVETGDSIIIVTKTNAA